MSSVMANALKTFLFTKADPDKLVDMMSPGRVGLLSARCCNPSAVAKDEQVIEMLTRALEQLEIDTAVQVESITVAQKALRKLSGRLDENQQQIVDELMRLFQSKGLSMFPVVLIDGAIASYGGVPTAEGLAEQLDGLKHVSA